MANRYFCGTYSFGSTGEKQLIIDLGGDVPVGIRCSFGSRVNTTESNIIYSEGVYDGTNTICRTVYPGGSKKWPYTGETSYVAVAYSTGGTKQVSLKPSTVNTPFQSDLVCLNADVASSSSYQMTLEAWS